MNRAGQAGVEGVNDPDHRKRIVGIRHFQPEQRRFDRQRSAAAHGADDGFGAILSPTGFQQNAGGERLDVRLRMRGPPRVARRLLQLVQRCFLQL